MASERQLGVLTLATPGYAHWTKHLALNLKHFGLTLSVCHAPWDNETG